jgi:outer membrane protein assembly factor BamD
MKKILLPLLVCATVVLSACSNESVHDSYAAYRNQTAKELYLSSKKDLLKGHDDNAVKKLEALNALYPFGVYSEEGSINLVYAYYENDQPEEALAAADRYLRLYPRGHYADYAYYLKGIVSLKQDLTWLQRKAGIDLAPRDLANAKEAYLSFNELISAFPDSVYAPDAIARIRYIRNLFAEKELSTAQFYYARQAYVAAINRASEVVVHYDGSPSVVPALAVMVKSYRKIGLTTQANNTLKILGASYPTSKEFKSLSH